MGFNSGFKGLMLFLILQLITLQHKRTFRTFGLTAIAVATATEAAWSGSLCCCHIYTPEAHSGSGNNGKSTPSFQLLWPQLLSNTWYNNLRPYSNVYIYIYIYISNKMHMLQSLFYLTTTLHVSGVTITHLQEHKTTVTTPSDNRYTILLSAAIVEEFKLMWVCCGWRNGYQML